ncbi:hypothetical protein [Candidatus Poriferisodalis sp.]|uniref:hypothetical protein n=1 Tax=Candidatus Poriferisodalis sp. TaxID=3101277 RepID=UPI003B5C39F2
MSGGGTVATPPRAPAHIPAAVLWIGPAAALRDASIGAGILWYAAQVAAIWAGALTFGLFMTAIAVLGGWQAASVRGRADAMSQPHGDDTPAAPATLEVNHRLPAAALAGAVGFAGVLDTRLAGAVLGAAVIASFIVVGALRASRGSAGATAREHALPPAVLARAGLLIRTWMHVGVAAACSAAIARYSLGATLVLVTAAAAYDAGAHLTAAGRPPGVRGPFVGLVAAVITIFALTGLSVPPFAPSDVIEFGALAALTLAIGPAVARPMTAFAARPRRRLADSPNSANQAPADSRAGQRPRARERAWLRLSGEWAVRRIDSLSVTALVWMWGLGLLAI